MFKIETTEYNKVYNKIFQNLPIEIINNIFLYNSIYHEIYQKTISALNCCLVKYEDSIYKINKDYNINNYRFNKYTNELFYFIKLFFNDAINYSNNLVS